MKFLNTFCGLTAQGCHLCYAQDQGAPHQNLKVDPQQFYQSRFHEADYRIAPLTTASFVQLYQAATEQGLQVSLNQEPSLLMLPNRPQTQQLPDALSVLSLQYLQQ
jgi:hypothetical protein